MREIAAPNGPGWEHETRSGSTYWLWMPRPDRPRWAACWQDANETAGDFRRGDALADVLSIFPASVRSMFRKVAK